MAVDRLVPEDGNALETAAGHLPRDGPMRADRRERAPLEFNRATTPARDPTGSQRKTLAGITRRRATVVPLQPAGRFRPTIRHRGVADIPRRDRTRLLARTIPHRDLIRARAFPAVVDIPRRDRTRLPSSRRARAVTAEVRALQADALRETRALREAVREAAADTAGEGAIGRNPTRLEALRAIVGRRSPLFPRRSVLPREQSACLFIALCPWSALRYCGVDDATCRMPCSTSCSDWG